MQPTVGAAVLNIKHWYKIPENNMDFYLFFLLPFLHLKRLKTTEKDLQADFFFLFFSVTQDSSERSHY